MNCKKQKKHKIRQWYLAQDINCEEIKAEYLWRLARYRELKMNGVIK